MNTPSALQSAESLLAACARGSWVPKTDTERKLVHVILEMCADLACCQQLLRDARETLDLGDIRDQYLMIRLIDNHLSESAPPSPALPASPSAGGSTQPKLAHAAPSSNGAGTSLPAVPMIQDCIEKIRHNIDKMDQIAAMDKDPLKPHFPQDTNNANGLSTHEETQKQTSP